MFGHQIITGRKIGPYIQIFPPVRLSIENTNRKKYANDARINTIVCSLHS